MKALRYILGVVFLLVIGGIAILPMLVPMETVTAEIKTQVKQATGRDLDFSGATLMLWPNLGVELSKVTLSNPSWAKERTMISLDKAEVALALKPLLQRHIEIKKFVFNAPVIHLEVAADGKNNWDFSTGKAAPQGGKAAGEGAAGIPEGFDLKFGQVKISDGKLTFADRQKGTSSSVDDINVKVDFPDLGSSLKLEGSLKYQQKPVQLTLGLDKPMAFLQGKESAGRGSLKTEYATAQAEGTLSTGETLLKGTIDAKIHSLGKFLAWAGDGQQQKLPFEKVSFASEAQLSKSYLTLRNAALTLDEVEAKGNVNLALEGKPGISARLTLNKLNLDRFTGGDTAADGSAGQESPEGWSTAPFDFSALKVLNANLELKAGGFTLKGAEVGPSTLTLVLRDSNLHLKSSEATLFDGKFSSELTLNAAPAVPTMAFTFKTNDVQAKPVLTTFVDFRKLSGTADANVSVTAAGNNQRAMVSSLDGSGSAVFRNGSLEGIDLVNIAKLVQKNLTDMGVGAGKTDFVELGGTFTINNGIASNTDLRMKGPLVQATGQGQIDLPQKYVQYRVIPVLTASSAVEGARGIAVPVDIQGPFDRIKVKPDFTSVVRDVINDPTAAKETLKNVREQGKVIKENFKDLKKDPARALQNILQGGGLFAQPSQEPVQDSVLAPEPQPEPQPQPVP